MNYCPECGTEINSSVNFCPKCGYSLPKGEQRSITSKSEMINPKIQKALILFVVLLASAVLGYAMRSFGDNSKENPSLFWPFIWIAGSIYFGVFQSKNYSTRFKKILLGFIWFLLPFLVTPIISISFTGLNSGELVNEVSMKPSSKIEVIFYLNVAAKCSAMASFPDISEGVQVHILDSDGKLLGSGDLGPGEKGLDGGCSFTNLSFKVNRSEDGIYKAQVGNESRGFITQNASAESELITFFLKIG